jgi:pimeloyl-ACP methyl ester carboxylesterase
MAHRQPEHSPLYYETNGTGQPALLFVHGYCRSLRDWDFQVEYLQSRYHVIACDLPGHGKSGYSAGELSIEGFGAAIAQVIEEAQLNPVVLVGHSLGCRVVLQTYLYKAASVVGLILIDGSWCSSSGLSEVRARIAVECAQEGFESYLRRQFDEMFFEESDPALKQRIVAEALTTPRAVAEPLMYRTIEWDGMQMERALSKVTVPLLVLQSTFVDSKRHRVTLKEGESTPWLELVQRLVLTAQVRILPGVGHFSMLEAPSWINRAIERFVTARFMGPKQIDE